MIRVWISFGLLLAAIMAWAAPVQEQPSGTYRLQVEDIIRIQVWNEQQINAVVPVGRDGNISAPFVGIIRAAGKTTTELENDLAIEYQKILKLRNPRVSVTIERFRSIRASVGGYVNRPGFFEMRQGDRILDLLNNGGGFIADRADLRRATLLRGGSSELIPIDLHAMLIRGDTSQNYLVQDGDVLNIPEETRNRILVLGAVQQPGTYFYKEPMTVLDAFSQARGEVRYRTWLSRTVVIRERPGLPGQYMRIQVDMVKFFNGQDPSQNIELRPGDAIYFPETKTPDIDRIASVVNSMFFLDRFFRDNIFGLRILGR